ncbi:MAG: KUP/HAK/KT family potassium transporter [Burkholderiales bacterium]|nr:KUP/HAK/KT family potassium transporter [Burkholderiales bacterium]
MQPSSGAPPSLKILTLTALGVVFGDIGTSPLYAFKVLFSASLGIPSNDANVLAGLSLIFWAVMLIVSLKYVTIVLNFDNRGEGGILALLAFAGRLLRGRPRLQWVAASIAVLGASLFFGDAIITPAISVLSAVEGLTLTAPGLHDWVVPITVAVLVLLFVSQRRGTATVGRFFGWIMLGWFGALALLGVQSIIETPQVLAGLDPRHALRFAADEPAIAFAALGAVFLALTGGEALYADMGHFGPRPIRFAWFGIVLPALMLNYFGQGALVLRDGAAISSPFYLLAPTELLPLVIVLATAATVIASQATISGAFSVTQQASRLGYLPRVTVLYTSESQRGQIYIPRVNWLLLILVVALVLEFRESDALAAAYGIAVSTTMVLETSLVVMVVCLLRPGYGPLLIAVLGAIGCVELVFFASNATKFVSGGWFPIAVAGVLFTMLTTWKLAADTITASEEARRVPTEGFMATMAEVPRVPGSAIFFTAERNSVPTALLHNFKHNKVLHDRLVFLSVVTDDVPRLPDAERVEIDVIERGHCYAVALHYGFREEPDIPQALKLLAQRGLNFELEETTFFLGKTRLARAEKPGPFTWRRDLFRWMQNNSPSAAEYFHLPPARVIEIGTQISV